MQEKYSASPMDYTFVVPDSIEESLVLMSSKADKDRRRQRVFDSICICAGTDKYSALSFSVARPNAELLFSCCYLLQNGNLPHSYHK